jgi:D-alanyl-lipoteichoic acid acyltransferase DltB (MBOAT superfamily)
MVALLRLIVPFVLLPSLCGLLFRLPPSRFRTQLFALINVAGALGLCLLMPMTGIYFWQLPTFLRIAVPVLGVYLAAVLLQYFLMRACAHKPGWTPSIAFLFPILFMLVVKYGPALSSPFSSELNFVGKRTITEFMIGISYMAFRLSRLVLEVRNGGVPSPTVSEYLSFAFFLPTFAVGPISKYRTFWESLHKPDRAKTPVEPSLMRMLVGLTKYLFLSSIVEQLSYTGLLLDGHPHAWIDLPIAAVAYYVYLYLNFSGYCDLAIGVSGLIGIQVDENFNAPFLSRNVQELWIRWHMTLSSYMREMLFSPLSMFLIRKFGQRVVPHAIAVSIFSVFVAIGAWHGLAWNFLLFGAMHGVGVVSCHYYTIWLKKSLGKAGYEAYNNNLLIQTAARTATFLFMTLTLFFFANSVGMVRTVMDVFK